MRRFNEALSNIQLVGRGDLLQWPDRQRMAVTAQYFDDVHKFPGVVGAIDGTYIEIPKPEDGAGHFCRMRYPAQHLQIVCNENLEIIHAEAGNAGSMHDARVYRNSEVSNLLTNPATAPPDDCHILGDSAYPLQVALMTPYRRHQLVGNAEQNYNRKHSAARSAVEGAFGLLKGKWRRLGKLEAYNMDVISSTVFTCCLLHNFVLIMSGIAEDDIVPFRANQPNQVGRNQQLAHNKRDGIAANLPN